MFHPTVRLIGGGLAIALAAACQPLPLSPPVGAPPDAAAEGGAETGFERDVVFDVDPMHAAIFPRPEYKTQGISLTGNLRLDIDFPMVRHDPATGRTLMRLQLTNAGDTLTFLKCQLSAERKLVGPGAVFNSTATAANASQSVDLTFENPSADAFTVTLRLTGTVTKRGTLPLAPNAPSSAPSAAPTPAGSPIPAPSSGSSSGSSSGPSPAATPSAKPSPKPSGKPAPVPSGVYLETFDTLAPGAYPRDYVDPLAEGFSFDWLVPVKWRVAVVNGNRQYMHDGLADRAVLSFRRYKGEVFGPDGQLPNRYYAEVDVTSIESRTYRPTGDQGTQFYYLDPTHYVELLIKPTLFEVWVCNGAEPFQAAKWERLYFTPVSTNANQTRKLAAEVDCQRGTLKAYLDGQLMTTLSHPMLAPVPHYFALRGAGNIVVHDNVRIEPR